MIRGNFVLQLGMALIVATCLAGMANAQVIMDFNDVALGDLSGQAGGTGWDAGDTWTPSSMTDIINVESGDLIAPAGTNYSLTQTGTPQHVLGTGGAVSYFRALDTPTGNSGDTWFSFLGQIEDAGADGPSNARAGITIDADSNTGRFLMRGITATDAGDPLIPDMEIFREPGGGANDYDLDTNPFLIVGRLMLNPDGADLISWWLNPDVTSLDPNVPDESYSGRNWDGDDGIARFGVTVYGSDQGRMDAFRFSTGANAYMDVTGSALPPSALIEWAVDADGNYSVGSNWVGGVAPGAGADLLLGTAISEDRTVTVDTPADANSITFSTFGAGYTIADDGSNTLTLSGDASLSVSGNHRIEATVAGTSGLTKAGGGTIFLSGDNTYTGVTDVQGGLLRVENVNSVNGDVAVASGAIFVFQGIVDDDGMPTGAGYSGVFSGDITGEGQVAVSDTLSTEVVTFNNAKSFDGVISVNGGTLEVSDPGALGTGGVGNATRTALTGGTAIGKLRLVGDINVVDEQLDLDSRTTDAVHLSSDGNNSWGGNVDGQGGGTQYNIESTSGTLTLGGLVSAPDGSGSPVRTYVFSGAGNVNVTGAITDDDVDADGIRTASTAANVSVVKRGSGTLTISTATEAADDFWFGTTNIEEGTMQIVAGTGDVGEIRSPSIAVRSGAKLDVASFGLYNLQVGQQLSGAGTIEANSFGMFDDNIVSPGDSVGTLSIQGDVSYGGFNAASGGMNFELGSTTTVGGGVNDLIEVSESLAFSGTGGDVNVISVDGELAAGTYTIMTADSVTGTPNSTLTARITDSAGNSLTTRQTVAITSTGSTVGVTVSGSAANLVWTGANDSNWSTIPVQNWSNGGSPDAFVNLDKVTFNDMASTKSVVVSGRVIPGTVDFNHTGTYTLTGTDGIEATGAINVNSGTAVLANGPNAGTVNVASGATFQGSGSGTTEGTISGSVTVAAGGTFRIGDDGIPGAPPITSSEDFENFGPPMTGVVFTANAATGTPAMPGWNLIDGRSSTSTQAGNDDVEMELADTSFTGSIALNQTNRNTDFPDTGGAHNGSMAISPLDASGALDTVTATIGQDDPSGGFADVSIVFAYQDQDNYAYAQATQGQGLWIFVVENDSRIQIDQLGVGSFQNATPWDATLVHNALTGEVTFAVSDGTNTGTISTTDSRLQADGRVGFGSHNDAWFADDVSVTTEEPGAVAYTVDGDVMLEAGATLSLDVNSLGSFDRLIVTGNLEAGGTLEFLAGASFTASAGDAYDIFDFATATGSFGTFDLPALDSGLTWDTSSLLIDGVLSITAPSLACDFDGDGNCDITDLDALTMELAGGGMDLTFDVNGDGIVDDADLSEWLTVAGAENLPSGNAYLVGDSDLDGAVDVSDFNNWNAAKFTATGKWSQGDFNADGASDVSDFNEWNNNKFQSALDDGVNSVPEPGCVVLLAMAAASLLITSRRGS